MDDLVRYASVGLAAIVVGACICRIDLMVSVRNRLAWWAVHVLFAVHALGEGLDRVMGMPMEWYDTAGLFGVWLYLWETRRGWTHRAPRETEHDDLRQADGRRIL